jgi:hypothetical protein
LYHRTCINRVRQYLIGFSLAKSHRISSLPINRTCLKPKFAGKEEILIVDGVGDADRQVQLQNLVDRKLQDVQKAQLKITVSGKEVVVREQVRKVVHAILSAKDAIGSAVTAEPHAALAWAGVLVILPVSIAITIASAFHAEICLAVVSEPDYAG